MKLIPRNPVPNLDLPLAGGGRFDLSKDHGPNGTMLVFYRGLHCPICHRQLKALDAKLTEFDKRGVVSVAISSDGEDRAHALAREVGGAVKIAYDMPLNAAREEWGLYISASRGTTSIGVEEPSLFHEPGLMLIRPDQTLYFLSIQSMPFSRPPFDDILSAIDSLLEKNYPARGHFTGELDASGLNAAE